MRSLSVIACTLLAAVSTMAAISRSPGDNYYVGVGIGDITGPAAEVNLMGYANPVQTSKGIHLRVFARAFIFADGPTSKNRFVFVSGDMGMMSQLVKLDVLIELKKLYGDLYTADNVILSGTHTHSGTAGFFQYFIFEVTSLGFVKESHEQFVRGIVAAIQKAHNDLSPGNLYLNSGLLQSTQINRSPTAYLMNPPAERAMYPSDTDFNMHLVRINDVQGHPRGMINWYPVHGVSMNNTNRLISGDNKGWAAQQFERTMEPQSMAGRNKFVAAFAQAFEGDVSPNTAGPKCIDTGLPCDLESSTCNGKPTNCIAFGPGKDMVESTKIIGDNQFKKAMELFNAANDNGIKGQIKFIHKYVDMSNYTFNYNGQNVKTCIPALGYSFAAGTIDGPGLFAFSQGTESGNPFWDAVRNLLKPPTPEMIACHAPKPILLTTGLMDYPYAWHPKIIDVQMAQIGQLVIAAVPGEFTTMSGRRLISALTKVYADAGQTVQVVIAGLSNVYTHYITTPEEYQRQRYEGASNIFGPNSLPAYISIFTDLAKAMINNQKVDEGPQPPYLKDEQWSILPPVVYDGSGSRKFGDVIQGPKASYKPGDVVSVVFQGANPRNSMGQLDHDAFLHVDQQVSSKRADEEMGFLDRAVRSIFNWGKDKPKPVNDDANWKTIFTDAEWETRFEWERDSTVLGTSNITVEWTIPAGQAAGNYRMCYFGHNKNLVTGIKPFSGCSQNFAVTNSFF